MLVVERGKCRFDAKPTAVKVNEKRKLLSLFPGGGFGSVHPNGDVRRDVDIFGLDAGFGVETGRIDIVADEPVDSTIFVKDEVGSSVNGNFS